MKIQRKVNHTGRKKLDNSKLEILIHEPDDGDPHFDFKHDFEGLKLPAHAKIFVEPYYKSSFMRFSFGTVGEPLLPENTKITDIDHGSSILFRVLVVDDSEDLGRLLASADRVSPSNLDDKEDFESIISVREKDLGNQTWKLDLAGAGPELVINNRIPAALSRIKHDAIYQGLIFPSIIREILNYILIMSEDPGEDDEATDTWQIQWLSFSKNLVDREIPGEDDIEELQEWIDDVVSEFCNQNKICDKIIDVLEESS
jgi:hypothetical protein